MRFEYYCQHTSSSFETSFTALSTDTLKKRIPVGKEYHPFNERYCNE